MLCCAIFSVLSLTGGHEAKTISNGVYRFPSGGRIELIGIGNKKRVFPLGMRMESCSLPQEQREFDLAADAPNSASYYVRAEKKGTSPKPTAVIAVFRLIDVPSGDWQFPGPGELHGAAKFLRRNLKYPTLSVTLPAGSGSEVEFAFDVAGGKWRDLGSFDEAGTTKAPDIAFTVMKQKQEMQFGSSITKIVSVEMDRYHGTVKLSPEYRKAMFGMTWDSWKPNVDAYDMADPTPREVASVNGYGIRDGKLLLGWDAMAKHVEDRSEPSTFARRSPSESSLSARIARARPWLWAWGGRRASPRSSLRRRRCP